MNFRNLHAVHPALCLGNCLIYRPDVFFYGVGGADVRDPVPDFLHAAVMMVILVMVVLVKVFVLLGVAHKHMDAGALNAAFLRRLPLVAHPGDPQSVQLLHHRVGIGKELQQGGGEHISGGPHAAV